MATYLDLVNKVLVRLNEVQLTSSSFNSNAANSGFYAQAKNAVNDAVQDICRRYREWPFLHTATTFTTTAGVRSYTISSTTFPYIDWNTFYVGRDDSASPPITAYPLQLIEYTDYVQNRLPLDIQQTTSTYSQPWGIVRPQTGDTLLITPTPDRQYVINYEYWVVVTDMSAATDVCVIPDEFTPILIDTAMKYAYQFRENEQGAARYEKSSEAGIAEMVRKLIPHPIYMKSPYVGRKKMTSIPSRFM